jgi:site-specific DNA-methyltransferase (adenine-specific)
MTPYYDDGTCVIYHGDSRAVLPAVMGDTWAAGACVILDPPWDDSDLWGEMADATCDAESLIAFTDARRFRDPLAALGPPDWVFTWDTLNTWSVSPRQPVQQTKHALWYGATYSRDAVLWGDPPPKRDHPTTKQTPLDGRRLTDLWRESLRWLHHPSAGNGSAGTERFSARQGDPAYRHAKPVGWLRCLIGNTSSGPVIDPFLGSGSSLRAAMDLGRRAVGVDVDERCCQAAAERLAQGVLDFGGIA